MTFQVQKYSRKVSYQDYKIDFDKVYYQKIIWAIRVFSSNPKGKLLDIGCWDGTLAAQLIAERECYGIEGNIEACKIANENGIRAQAVDVEKGLPFDKDFFDCVIAAEVIEHLYDTDFFLQEIRRVLTNKGMLVMSVPNIACFTNRITMLFGKYPRYAEYKAGGAGHIRIYTAKAIKDQLAENGFDVVYYAGCNLPLPMHNKLVPKWIKKIAVKLGDHFPTIAGQVILAGIKR